MWRVLLLCCVAFSLSLVAGCNEGPAPHNFSYIFNSFDGNPDTTVHSDPGADLTTSRTYALDVGADERDSLAAKQLAWLAMKSLETRGYRRAENPDQADIRVHMSINNEYREQYIPPQEYTEDVWVPAKEVEVKLDTNEYGTYYGNSRTRGTVTVPGHYETQTVKRPGRTDSAYYPSVSLQVLDANRLRAGAAASDALVWEGRSVGRSSLENVVLTGQWLVREIIGRFPVQQEASRPDPGLPAGRMGAFIETATADGASFYPVIGDITKGSPADRAGLRRFDFITALDGITTANMSGSEFVRRLRGEPGTVRTLQVRRLNEVKTVTITLVSEADLTRKRR